MHSPMPFRSAAIIASALLLAACGSRSTDTVEDSKTTVLSGGGLIEGTTNDASALEGGMNSAVAAPPAPARPAPEKKAPDDAEPADNAT